VKSKAVGYATAVTYLSILSLHLHEHIVRANKETFHVKALNKFSEYGSPTRELALRNVTPVEAR